MSGTNTLSTTAASLTGTDQTTVELTLATALTASATNLTVALIVQRSQGRSRTKRQQTQYQRPP